MTWLPCLANPAVPGMSHRPRYLPMAPLATAACVVRARACVPNARGPGPGHGMPDACACTYPHARMTSCAYGLASRTGVVLAAGETHPSLPLVALAGSEQRPLARGRRIFEVSGTAM